MSTMVKGIYSSENEVFASQSPCIFNVQQLTSIIHQNLKADKVAQLWKHAETLGDVQKDLRGLWLPSPRLEIPNLQCD